MLNHLPSPNTQAISHSGALTQYIIKQIDQHSGMINFAQFMQHALYAPGLGYYSAGQLKFGASGDFITAPEVSPYFAKCLANQCAQILPQISHGEILEFGAGTGLMAAQILNQLDTIGQLPQCYLILEPSPDLQQRQHQTLAQNAPHLLPRVKWLTSLPTTFNGIILANEVLDAMPVHRVRLEAQQQQELYVSHSNHQFTWVLATPSSPELAAAATQIHAQLGNNQTAYQTEINLNAQHWITTLGHILQSGVIILIDYGYPAHEYYHSARSQGTLMCYYQHHAHDDPFYFPGLQDITAHVDFSAIAHSAHAAGLDISGYCTQGNFLLNCGITDTLETLDPNDTKPYFTATQQIKKLTMPNEMGELFKVLALSKHFDSPLLGFTSRNQLSRL